MRDPKRRGTERAKRALRHLVKDVEPDRVLSELSEDEAFEKAEEGLVNVVKRGDRTIFQLTEKGALHWLKSGGAGRSSEFDPNLPDDHPDNRSAVMKYMAVRNAPVQPSPPGKKMPFGGLTGQRSAPANVMG